LTALATSSIMLSVETYIGATKRLWMAAKV
jgi:hypothetical protein